MPPLAIHEDNFKNYPPEAKTVASTNIGLFQQLPKAFLPLLLDQIRSYDWRFPAERRDIDRQLAFLRSLTDAQRDQVLGGFVRLGLPVHLNANWVNSPREFTEQLSGYLWSSHQIEAFRQASSHYLEEFNAAAPPALPAIRRLGIAVLGKDIQYTGYPLFRKLRPHGTYFTRVNPANGLRTLLDGVAARASDHPAQFDHWYVDGGIAEPVPESVATISYAGLESTRSALLRRISREIKAGIPGPEALTSLLHKIKPEDLGLPSDPQHSVLSHFKISLLTEGSGTQIFSTTFVQWTTRELWRRAQPVTVMARFTPRQRERPMNELLSGEERNLEMDPAGSLIDADMGAFYMWIDQQRLSGANDASFLVWLENRNEALLVSPLLPRNTESSTSVDMHWLLAQIT
jgi:hypothetical protein